MSKYAQEGERARQYMKIRVKRSKIEGLLDGKGMIIQCKFLQVKIVVIITERLLPCILRSVNVSTVEQVTGLLL